MTLGMVYDDVKMLQRWPGREPRLAGYDAAGRPTQEAAGVIDDGERRIGGDGGDGGGGGDDGGG